MYCAVSALLNTVIPPETISKSLVQVTVVAGPPMEVQVRMNSGQSPLRSEPTLNVIPPGMVTSPSQKRENTEQIYTLEMYYVDWCNNEGYMT